MADETKKDPKDAKIAELEAKLAAKGGGGFDEVKLGEVLAAAMTKGRNDANRPDLAALRVNQPLAPEHRGTKTYIVGPRGHFRGDRLYAEGELVTVTDERPAIDWKLADKDAVEKKIAAKAEKPEPSGRAADRK